MAETEGKRDGAEVRTTSASLAATLVATLAATLAAAHAALAVALVASYPRRNTVKVD
jgi:NADH:ubiquinone oxidoreductase subunit K